MLFQHLSDSTFHGKKGMETRSISFGMYLFQRRKNTGSANGITCITALDWAITAEKIPSSTLCVLRAAKREWPGVLRPLVPSSAQRPKSDRELGRLPALETIQDLFCRLIPTIGYTANIVLHCISDRTRKTRLDMVGNMLALIQQTEAS